MHLTTRIQFWHVASGVHATKRTVGLDTPKFSIHKDFICHYSPFFKAAFNSNFKEGQTQEITLDVDEIAFGVIANWFYTQKILDTSGKVPLQSVLARVWILADRFLIPVLQNQVMDCLGSGKSFSGAKAVIDFITIAMEYKQGDNELVHWVLWVMSCSASEPFRAVTRKLPLEAVVRIAQSLKDEQSLGNRRAITEKGVGQFHVKTRMIGEKKT